MNICGYASEKQMRIAGFIGGAVSDRTEQGGKSIEASVDKFLQPVIPSPVHGSLVMTSFR